MRVTCLILCILPLLSTAQLRNYTIGARHQALGGTSVTLADPWAAFNNPGALGSYDQSTAIAGFQNRYNISNLMTIAGGATYSHPWFTLAAKYYKFGDKYYSEQMMGLTIANRLQMVSFGGGISLLQTRAEGLQPHRKLALELGGTAEITPQILLGVHLFNLKHGSIYPTTMKAGFSFRPQEQIMLNTEIEKQLNTRERIKTGMEYQVIEFLAIRTGIMIQNHKHSKTQITPAFGFGVTPGKLTVDYAFSAHTLGAVHELSVGLTLKEP
ncbi:hypothetical protein [Marinoscillum furvescens]|uniref:PorV/PorQ family protein n=1 Tax=Marinoscillum furvescens DSM 4134 TaxID=1122208 RepID=A0A3D9L2B6_MARFU|nr:hypothetical protein [Marinoscillum furvescens]RED96652.1 hypothetical protein C7460_114110 [Marinoscillum furvescens DSM 4134]